jgi:hypothetical protein
MERSMAGGVLEGTAEMTTGMIPSTGLSKMLASRRYASPEPKSRK